MPVKHSDALTPPNPKELLSAAIIGCAIPSDPVNRVAPGMCMYVCVIAARVSDSILTWSPEILHGTIGRYIPHT